MFFFLDSTSSSGLVDQLGPWLDMAFACLMPDSDFNSSAVCAVCSACLTAKGSCFHRLHRFQTVSKPPPLPSPSSSIRHILLLGMSSPRCVHANMSILCNEIDSKFPSVVPRCVL